MRSRHPPRVSQYTPQAIEGASEAAKSRALAIKLNQRRQIIDDMQQQQIKLASFQSAILLSPLMDYNTVVAEERELQLHDLEYQYAIFMDNMARVSANAKTSESIRKKLSDSQIMFFNSSFADFYKELSTTFQKQTIPPQVFISFLLKYLDSKMSPDINTAANLDGTASYLIDYPQATDVQPVIETAEEAALNDKVRKVQKEVDKNYLDSDLRKGYVKRIWGAIRDNRSDAYKFAKTFTEMKVIRKRDLSDTLSIEMLGNLEAALADNGFLANSKAPAVAEPAVADETSGNGLRSRAAWKHRRVIHGRGVDPEAAQAKKYYLDLKMLRSGQLCVKYVSNQQFKIKPTPINRDVEGVLMDIVKQDFNQRLYDKLKPADKKIIQYFVRTMKLDDEVPIRSDDLEKTFEDWEIYRGEYMGGNNSPEVRAGLRRTTLELANMKRISTSTCHQILAVLGASG